MNHDVPKDPQSVLKNRIKGISEMPGVYRFYDSHGDLLYVGKARNLKKRLSSYLRTQTNTRLSTLVSQIAQLEITLTQTENEALLLESNLIKILKPRYNVLLRDDKTYPYLVLNPHDQFPRLYAYRGKPKGKSEYFGPYPSIMAMRETLNLLQKLFKLRSCRDSFFKNRTRPCMQYQIKRCTAPCVGLISQEDYQVAVNSVRLFLKGKSIKVIQQLTHEMETASTQQDYEKASNLLNQIRLLREIQQQQAIITRTVRNTDVINWSTQGGLHCVYILPIRQGEIIGGQAYFPTVPAFSEKAHILSAFITQFYTEIAQPLPEQIIIDTELEEQKWLAQALSTQHATSVFIHHKPNKTQTEWLKFSEQNAEQALADKLRTQQQQYHQRFILQKELQLPHIPERLECFDISHTQGEATQASCVVFNSEGPSKKDYRRFNIKNITPGDDYAAMHQALKRRFTSKSNLSLPDLLIIDGGKGQLTQAITILNTLNLDTQISLVAIAKGPSRKPGYETLFLTQHKSGFALSPESPALHLLQHIRDEAHRFAITGHRKQRAKKRNYSVLEHIPGIGPKKRKQLLVQFGGLQKLKQASLYEIEQIHGITAKLAQSIYTALKNSA